MSVPSSVIALIVNKYHFKDYELMRCIQDIVDSINKAGYYLTVAGGDLTTHRTAALIDHPNDSITVDKLAHNIDAIAIGFGADKTDTFHASKTPTANTIVVSGVSNKIDNGWLWTGHGAGLDADMVDNRHYSDIATEIDTDIATHNTDFNSHRDKIADIVKDGSFEQWSGGEPVNFTRKP